MPGKSESCDCVFHFIEGGEYLVFSFQRGSEKQFYTHSWSGIKRLDEAEVEKTDLSYIAKESVPMKKVDLKSKMVSGLNWREVAFIFIGVLVIISVVIFVVKRTRKK